MRQILRLILLPWEWLYSLAARTRPVPDGTGLGRFSLHPHEGAPVLLSDGQTVAPGSTILELHLVNSQMKKVMTNDKAPASNELVLRKEYEKLARAARDGEIPDFAAVYGLTLMSPLVKRLKFDVSPAEDTRQNRMIARWQGLLRKVFHPTGQIRKTRRQLYVYWMSRDKLIDLYAPENNQLVADDASSSVSSQNYT